MSQHDAPSVTSRNDGQTIPSQPQAPVMQEAMVVKGNGPLHGDVRIAGAKNSALKLFAAALLAPGEYFFTNVPKITDIPNMLELVKYFGGDYVLTSGEIVDSVALTINETINPNVPPALFKKLRASIQCLGPVLARVGEVTIASPGGDKIGERAIDIHLDNLKAMGATVEEIPDGFRVCAPQGLHGAECDLSFRSVGATETILMAATLAEGTTIIKNAAEEPEIVDLCNMLKNMGAKISGAGTDEIVVEGCKQLHALTEPHHVVPDRIEAGTYMMAALLTGGDVTIHHFDPETLSNPIKTLSEAGAEFVLKDNMLRVKPCEQLANMDVVALTYPGWPTDLLSPTITLLTQTLGDSQVTETIFASRMDVVKELQRIGVKGRVIGNTAILENKSTITGGKVFAGDIRTGAALVLAGLISEEEVEVFNIEHIDRGYSNFVAKLKGLGANIQRVMRPIA